MLSIFSRERRPDRGPGFLGRLSLERVMPAPREPHMIDESPVNPENNPAIEN